MHGTNREACGGRAGRIVAWAIILALSAAYVGGIGSYAILDHTAIRTQTFDLGIYDQALWLVSRGHTPFVTVRGLHAFGDHTDFILYLLAPAYWLWDDARAIILLHTVAIASGGIAVFLLARDKLGDWPGIAFGLAFLLNPSVQNVSLDLVHPEAFAGTAMLWAFLAVTRRRYVWFAVLCGLAAICKEDVGIALFAMGAYLSIRGRARVGLPLMGLSAVWVFLCVKVFLPHFNQAGFFRLEHGWFAGLARNATNPSWYLATIFNREVGRYLLHLFAPLAFLPLLSPLAACMAGPAIMVNILSNTGYLRSVHWHYTTAITPFLFVAAVQAVAWLAGREKVSLALLFARKRKEADGGQETLPRWRMAAAVAALAGLLVASSWGNVSLSRFPLHRARIAFAQVIRAVREDGQVAATKEAIRLIPPDAAVSADYLAAPQITHRKFIYMFPNPFRASNWGVDDSPSPTPLPVQFILVRDNVLSPADRKLLGNLTRTRWFEKIFSRNGVQLLRHNPNPPDPRAGLSREGNGVRGYFYDMGGPIYRIPDVSRVPPSFKALIPSVEFPCSDGPFTSADGIQTGLRECFAALFEGFLLVERSGEYEFIVASDDGFRLLLDDRLVCECNQLHAFDKTRGTISLDAGIVPIRLVFFQNMSPGGLVLLYRPPEGVEMVVPPRVLFPTREAAEKAMRKAAEDNSPPRPRGPSG